LVKKGLKKFDSHDKSRIFVRQKSDFMKKKLKKTVGRHTTNDEASKVEEPQPTYFAKTVKALPVLKDFTYNEFKKIADKAPFTQAEWASILHVSERTLQRYAKNNGSFAPINAERALHIDKILKEAKITFGKIDNFYQWLKRNPYMLEGNLSFSSLTTYDGIEKVLTQLGRIQHGLFA
jgi:putative toxin-antitoxin system antitoxin component (TIGR02293 family)